VFGPALEHIFQLFELSCCTPEVPANAIEQLAQEQRNIY
jgi:hypothetical protein